jgi:hypothetical protein
MTLPIRPVAGIDCHLLVRDQVQPHLSTVRNVFFLSASVPVDGCTAALCRKRKHFKRDFIVPCYERVRVAGVKRINGRWWRRHLQISLTRYRRPFRTPTNYNFRWRVVYYSTHL